MHGATLTSINAFFRGRGLATTRYGWKVLDSAVILKQWLRGLARIFRFGVIMNFEYTRFCDSADIIATTGEAIRTDY